MPRLMLTLRPLCAAVALTTAAGLAVALPAQGVAPPPAVQERTVKSTQVARSSLLYTLNWAYDVNDKGVGYAAWIDGDASRRRVLVAKRNAKGLWAKPQRVSGLFSRQGKKAYAGYPDVAVDKKGRATVVWTQPMGKGVRLRVVTSRGKGWTKPRNLSAKADFAGFPDVEVSDNGFAVVHWAGRFPFPPEYPFTLLAAYRKKNGSWSRPTRLDTSPDFDLDARPGSIAIDDRGIATVAWDELGGSERIQVASRGPKSGWVQTSLAVGTNLNAPWVSTTADGHLAAAWRDADGIFVRRRSPSGVWDSPQEVVAGPAGSANNIFGLGISAKGRVALLGQQVVTAGNKVRPYVVVQNAPGSAWKQEFVAAAYPAYSNDTFLPDIRVGRRGEVAVTWNQQSKNPSRWFRVFVRTRSKAGRWKPAARVGRTSNDPVLGVDGKGRFSVVFGEGDRGGCCVSLRAARLR